MTSFALYYPSLPVISLIIFHHILSNIEFPPKIPHTQFPLSFAVYPADSLWNKAMKCIYHSVDNEKRRRHCFRDFILYILPGKLLWTAIKWSFLREGCVNTISVCVCVCVSISFKPLTVTAWGVHDLPNHWWKGHCSLPSLLLLLHPPLLLHTYTSLHTPAHTPTHAHSRTNPHMQVFSWEQDSEFAGLLPSVRLDCH